MNSATYFKNVPASHPGIAFWYIFLLIIKQLNVPGLGVVMLLPGRFLNMVLIIKMLNIDMFAYKTML